MRTENDNPLISVLVPVYNVEKYIDRCVRSIVNQTYKNLEIILVVQPSPDRTEDKVHKWKDRDKRIIVLYQSVPDVAMARNMLIRNARGTYVCYVDSDDLIDPSHIQTLYEIAKRETADIVQCRCYAFLDDRSIPANVAADNLKTEILSGRDYTYGILTGRYGSEANVVQTKLYRREMFEGITFPEMRVSEDDATTYKIAWNSAKVVVHTGRTYYYQSKRADSLTHLAEGRLRYMVNDLQASLEQLDFFEGRDKEIYNDVSYNICNRIMRLKQALKKRKQTIEVREVQPVILAHRRYVAIVLKSKLSAIKKIIAALGYISPDLTYGIWKFRRGIRGRREWKNKK